MNPLFPRTTVAGISLSRMLIGTNWILGYSHRGPADEATIRKTNSTPEAIADLLEVFLKAGVDTLMAPVNNPLLLAGIHLAEDRTGQGIILVDTPGINVDDNAQARRDAEKVIEQRHSGV